MKMKIVEHGYIFLLGVLGDLGLEIFFVTAEAKDTNIQKTGYLVHFLTTGTFWCFVIKSDSEGYIRDVWMIVHIVKH